MPDANSEFLKTAIERLELEHLQAKALEIVARDTVGMIMSVAASQVSSQTNRNRAACDQALLDLVGRGLLLRLESDQVRLFADYERLGIPADFRQFLIGQTFQVLGQPHSADAISTLRELFEDHNEEIYISMEVTTPETFPQLEQRSLAGRETIFLIPPRRNIIASRRDHYDEVLSEWVRLLKTGPSHLRENIRVCVSRALTKDLYTSALSRDLARIDLYNLSAASTRMGQILQVPR